ncbi:hypothetical protein BXO88_13050 [Oribacterium sp. C9]|uniref:hypothetical protein n=1 Tax=Oribacterium sp. C9 TaxID=1943579 RepID=UPI00098F4C86|nr:hypothetical protein [Oribacterium sp. C9]OON85305.1 hypothetical protein BXO88_13050 [Oribacterium sp. C9]
MKKTKKYILMILSMVLSARLFNFAAFAYTGWVHYTWQDFAKVKSKDGSQTYENNDSNGSFAYWYEEGKKLKNQYTPDGVYVGDFGYVPASSVSVTNYVEFQDTEEGKKIAKEKENNRKSKVSNKTTMSYNVQSKEDLWLETDKYFSKELSDQTINLIKQYTPESGYVDVYSLTDDDIKNIIFNNSYDGQPYYNYDVMQILYRFENPVYRTSIGYSDTYGRLKKKGVTNDALIRDQYIRDFLRYLNIARSAYNLKPLELKVKDGGNYYTYSDGVAVGYNNVSGGNDDLFDEGPLFTATDYCTSVIHDYLVLGEDYHNSRWGEKFKHKGNMSARTTLIITIYKDDDTVVGIDFS